MVSKTPRPHFTPGKDLAHIIQEAGWASGSVWTGGKSRPHRDSITDRPDRSQSLYRLGYRVHIQTNEKIEKKGYGFCLLGGRIANQNYIQEEIIIKKTFEPLGD